jgi:hypothetical protein
MDPDIRHSRRGMACRARDLCQFQFLANARRDFRRRVYIWLAS